MSTSEGGLPASQPVQLEDKVQLIDLNKPSLQKQREAYQAHTNNVLRYHPPIRSHELAHNIINERNIGELESAMQAFNEPTNQRIKQVHYVQR